MSRSRTRPGALLCTVLVFLAIAGDERALAVTDDELFRGFPFGFLEPGARAIRMGGAFTGLADDATAAYYNPAGLHFLSVPNVYVELASLSPDVQTFAASTGSPAVDPMTGPTDLPYLQVSGMDDPDSQLEVSFLSFAWPFGLGGGDRRLTLAGSRQIVLSSDRNLPANGGPSASFAFDTYPNTVVGNEVQVYTVETATTGQMSADITYWNVGISYDVTRDFSIGWTLSYGQLDLSGSSLTNILDPQEIFLDPTHPRLGGLPEQDVYGTRVDGTDSDFAWSFGVHWHPDSVFPGGRSPWGMGVVYRKGAEFSVPEEVTFNGIPDRSTNNRIVVPDQYAVGISYRTPEHWTFTIDYLRVEYSDLAAGYESGVNFLTSARLANASYEVRAGQPVEWGVDDVNVPRVGVEFRHAFGGDERRLIQVSAGYYRSGDHQLRMTQYNALDSAVNQAYEEAFGGGETLEHVTAGFGLLWNVFGFEIAGDTSEIGTAILGSFTFRFGRTHDGGKP